MRGLLKIALATAATLGAASPAYANDALVPGDPCGVGFVSAAGSSAIACVGYYGSNLLQGGVGSTVPQNIKDDLFTLLTNSTPGVQGSTAGYNPPYSADLTTVLGAVEGLGGADTFNFGTALSGLTIIGAHFGNNIDSDTNNVTAFWLFDITNPVGSNVVLADGRGSSNAQLFATGGAVPEPATWAMMLLGFGGIGMAVRRGRKAQGRLQQIA